MQSKPFVIFILILVSCLAIVGWYLLEAQMSMTNSGDYSSAETMHAQQGVQDVRGNKNAENFSQWFERKVSIVVNFVLQHIPVSFE
ncbi:MAG: hypothetical protein PHY73_06070 [Candidatus Omnitrophica bacterium]|nr:hypothetical protein [Candidatus Omnitrophota bacterium]